MTKLAGNPLANLAALGLGGLTGGGGGGMNHSGIYLPRDSTRKTNWLPPLITFFWFFFFLRYVFQHLLPWPVVSCDPEVDNRVPLSNRRRWPFLTNSSDALSARVEPRLQRSGTCLSYPPFSHGPHDARAGLPINLFSLSSFLTRLICIEKRWTSRKEEGVKLSELLVL